MNSTPSYTRQAVNGRLLANIGSRGKDRGFIKGADFILQIKANQEDIKDYPYLERRPE